MVCLVDSAARPIVGSEVDWSLARSHSSPPSLVSPPVPRALLVEMYSILCTLGGMQDGASELGTHKENHY